MATNKKPDNQRVTVDQDILDFHARATVNLPSVKRKITMEPTQTLYTEESPPQSFEKRFQLPYLNQSVVWTTPTTQRRVAGTILDISALGIKASTKFRITKWGGTPRYFEFVYTDERGTMMLWEKRTPGPLDQTFEKSEAGLSMILSIRPFQQNKTTNECFVFHASRYMDQKLHRPETEMELVNHETYIDRLFIVPDVKLDVPNVGQVTIKQEDESEFSYPYLDHRFGSQGTAGVAAGASGMANVSTWSFPVVETATVSGPLSSRTSGTGAGGPATTSTTSATGGLKDVSNKKNIQTLSVKNGTSVTTSLLVNTPPASLPARSSGAPNYLTTAQSGMQPNPNHPLESLPGTTRAAAASGTLSQNHHTLNHLAVASSQTTTTGITTGTGHHQSAWPTGMNCRARTGGHTSNLWTSENTPTSPRNTSDNDAVMEAVATPKKTTGNHHNDTTSPGTIWDQDMETPQESTSLEPPEATSPGYVEAADILKADSETRFCVKNQNGQWYFEVTKDENDELSLEVLSGKGKINCQELNPGSLLRGCGMTVLSATKETRFCALCKCYAFDLSLFCNDYVNDRSGSADPKDYVYLFYADTQFGGDLVTLSFNDTLEEYNGDPWLPVRKNHEQFPEELTLPYLKHSTTTSTITTMATNHKVAAPTAGVTSPFLNHATTLDASAATSGMYRSSTFVGIGSGTGQRLSAESGSLCSTPRRGWK
mmetsp:Transcript_36725/g.88784  ORF Transcript_36725/g.88784 Transcript_36725/m.88784 type:complete len:711 (-) Transcript_36725:907-3039(-)